MVPWAQIKGVEIFNGQVSVEQEGKWLSLGSTEAAKIPNLYAFLTVTERLRARAAAPAAAVPVDPTAGAIGDGTVIS